MRSFLVLALALLGGAGCAHADGAADRQIEDLRRGVDQTEAEQDRVNRRAAMIAETPDEKAARPVYPAADPQNPAAATPAGGSPRTVQIGQDDASRESDDPNDPAARPEIRLQGTAGPSAPRATRKSRRSDDDDSAPRDPGRKKRGDAGDSAAPKENR